MIDRWMCRRKVRGALEVAVVLWDGRGGWEVASTDHAQDHAMLSIPIGSCIDTAVPIFRLVNSVHTWMQLHT